MRKIMIPIVMGFFCTVSTATAGDIEWCIVHENTGKISSCYSSKVQCEQMTKNITGYSCVAK